MNTLKTYIVQDVSLEIELRQPSLVVVSSAKSLEKQCKKRGNSDPGTLSKQYGSDSTFHKRCNSSPQQTQSNSNSNSEGSQCQLQLQQEEEKRPIEEETKDEQQQQAISNLSSLICDTKETSQTKHLKNEPTKMKESYSQKR